MLRLSTLDHLVLTVANIDKSVQLQEVVLWVIGCGVEIIEGPVTRTGATGRISSIYLRDPDGNLIEIANRL